MIAPDARGYVTAAAVNLVMPAQEDRRRCAAVLGATLAVPDGQPLVWALRALGTRSRDARLRAGPDGALLRARRTRGHADVPLRRAHARGARAARRAAARALPGAAHRRRPLAAVSRADVPRSRSTVVAEIDASGAAVVWVGTGQPKQEQWMARDARPPRGAAARRRRRRLRLPRRPRLRRRPRWMQRNGLEWTYRLSREPRRLWRRYARYNPRFVAGFARQYARHLRRRRR